MIPQNNDYSINNLTLLYFINKVQINILTGEYIKILLDTNIIIHREASTVINDDIGILFRWLDNLHHFNHLILILNLSPRKIPICIGLSH